MTKERSSGAVAGQRARSQAARWTWLLLAALCCLVSARSLQAQAGARHPCAQGALRQGALPVEGQPRLPYRYPCAPGPGAPAGPAASESVPPALAEVLTSMASQAGVIFVGQVESVDREDLRGYVDVSFRVEQAVRGTSATLYVVREWAGLWTSEPDRYRAGERVLLLLRGRSGSGFSSPVGGMDGALPLLGGAQPPLLNAHGQVAPDPGHVDSAGSRVDLRWIATHVVRSPASPHGPSPPLPASTAAGANRPGVALAAVLEILRAAPQETFDGR